MPVKRISSLLLLIVATMLLLAVSVAFGATEEAGSKNDQDASVRPHAGKIQGAISAGAVMTVDVSNFNFAPSSVTINLNDTVIWQRISGFHNVAANNGSFRNGDPSSAWTTFSHTFTETGQFQYHCDQHANMVGTVIVQGATPTPTVTVTATPQPTTVAAEVRSNFFTPEPIKITVGDSVTWNRIEGFHNVVAADNSFTSGAANNSWTSFTQKFITAGEFRYYCEVHGSASGTGMAGKVIVTAATPPQRFVYLALVVKN